MTRVVDTEAVWTALETRLAYLQVGRLLAPELVSAQFREEAAARGLGFFHVTDSSVLVSCPEEPMLVLITGFEALPRTPKPLRCERLANWRAAVQALLPRCEEARILLLSRVPKASLRGCPGSQLIVDATPAFLRPDADALLAEAARISELPSSDIQRLARWYGHRPGLVLTTLEDVDPETAHNARLATAQQRAASEYIAAFEELGPDIVATLDHYVTELDQLTLDYTELDGLLVEALRGGGFVETSDDGRTVSLLPGPDRPRMREALRAVVDSTTQLPSGYLKSVEKLWFIERSLRSEVRRLLVERHGLSEWTRRLPGTEELHSRLVLRAAQEAFPRAESCRDLPNPLEWMTLGELTDTILSDETIRPFDVSDQLWRRMKTELAPVRDRIAHMRLLREGDDEVAARWQRQITRLQESPS